MSNWISVKDRLPDRPGEIIVAFSSGGVGLIHWALRDTPTQRLVTHWMPLPEPPPPPDQFREFFEATRLYTSVEEARIIWDAAVASTKQP